MKISDLFSAQLEREAVVSRRVLERVPEGRPDWKPHEKSMPLGYLSTLVGTMPSWVAMAVMQDELDLNPPGGSGYKPKAWSTTRELLQAHEEAVAKAKKALQGTTDDHLMTPWRLLVAGRVVNESPRHVVIADTFTHLAHHRGQLSVYLRLSGAAVPSIYGPSAASSGGSDAQRVADCTTLKAVSPASKRPVARTGWPVNGVSRTPTTASGALRPSGHQELAGGKGPEPDHGEPRREEESHPRTIE